MDSDDEMDCESENEEEVLEYETATLASLRGKELTVQNLDGTLRCPLSPSRKKQAYAYKDLLQHATAVASGKRGPEAAGRHSALKKFLQSDLASLATPAPERLLKVQQQLARRRQAEDMLVCPWSVVIYNIDNSLRDPNTQQQIGFGKTELQRYFADFKPHRIDVLWSHRGEGHLGVCVVHFGRDLSGLKDAQALENSFLDKELGLREYERRLPSGNLGMEFYGWLAREDDFKGRSGRKGEEIGRHLRKVGNLKDIAMVGDEMKRIHDQQVRQLAETVSEKNKESSHLKTQLEIVRRTAEIERVQLEESHKLELEAVRNRARASEEVYNRATLESNRALERREAELRQLDMELREKESKLNSAAEKDQLQTQMMENRHLREMLADQQGLLQQKQADKIKLVQKHEEETSKLAKLAQLAKLKLANKQKNEMEKQQLETILETEKLFDKLTITTQDTGDGSKKAEELEKKSKKVEELEEKLKELEKDQEVDQETMNTLVRKERESNDEIVDARKTAVEVMEALSSEDLKKLLIEEALTKRAELEQNAQQKVRVGVKMAGAIDGSPWSRAWRRKYKNDADWQLKMTTVLSKWETRLRNSGFQPFKTVKVGDDKHEKQIDDQNKFLLALKRDFGDPVYKSVTTALMEIEEYNASGRYPVPVAWIFEQSRKASLKEVITHLGEVIEGLLATADPRKKPRS